MNKDGGDEIDKILEAEKEHSRDEVDEILDKLTARGTAHIGHGEAKELLLAWRDKAKFAAKAEAYDDVGSMGAKHTTTIKIYAKSMADRYNRLSQLGAKDADQ